MKTVRVFFVMTALTLLLSIVTGAVPYGVAMEQSDVYYKGVSGMGETWEESRSISYTSYTKQTVQTSSRIPSLSNVNPNYQSNDCAPIAGGNIIAFYDILYSNLIPDYRTGRVINNNYIFNTVTTNQYLQKVIDDLYVIMKTNQITAGTREQDFLDGLTQYVEQAGLHFQTTGGLVSNNSVNVQALISHLNTKNIAVLFMTEYNIISVIEDTGNQLKFTAVCSNTPHIVAVYGVEQYTIIQNGVETTEYFLKIANNMEEFNYGLIRLNDYLNITDFLKINIS